MKLLLLTYEYPPFYGGVATYLFNLMQAAPADAQVVVDVPPKGEHWIKTGWRQYFKVRKEKPDMIAVSHVLPAGYVAFKINFWFKTPYIVFTHGTDILTARKNAWKRYWMNFVLKRAKIVVANSRFTAGLLQEEGIIGNVEVVTPGVNIPLQPTTYNLQANIVSVGRLVERKGFDTMIKAMPAILKEVPDARYTIIGNGPYYDELVRFAHELRVENFVQIRTDIDDAGKYRLLREASIFALPAKQVGNDVEGFGIAAIEAASIGLAVAVGRSGGATETVVDGVTGIVVEPDAPSFLAEAIIRLLKDPTLREKMGEAGREYVRKEYSIEASAKKFWDLIMEMNSPAHSGTLPCSKGGN
jgi:phosphatidyl-myo-inositol dimannoside synthase